MVSKCPVCGDNMTMHLHCDEYFIKNEHWYKAACYYVAFLNKMEKKKGILLELGVGFNTPFITCPNHLTAIKTQVLISSYTSVVLK